MAPVLPRGREVVLTAQDGLVLAWCTQPQTRAPPCSEGSAGWRALRASLATRRSWAGIVVLRWTTRLRGEPRGASERGLAARRPRRTTSPRRGRQRAGAAAPVRQREPRRSRRRGARRGAAARPPAWSCGPPSPTSPRWGACTTRSCLSGRCCGTASPSRSRSPACRRLRRSCWGRRHRRTPHADLVVEAAGSPASSPTRRRGSGVGPLSGRACWQRQRHERRVAPRLASQPGTPVPRPSRRWVADLPAVAALPSRGPAGKLPCFWTWATPSPW